MRYLYDAEKVKRGCRYCADAIRKKVRTVAGANGQTTEVEATKYCPYAQCIYHELDKCRSFAAYLKKMEKKYGTVAQMLSVRKK